MGDSFDIEAHDLLDDWLEQVDDPERRNLLFKPEDMAKNMTGPVCAVRVEAAKIRKRWELPWQLPFDDPATDEVKASNGLPDHDETLELRQRMDFLLALSESDDRAFPLPAEIVAFVERDLLES